MLGAVTFLTPFCAFVAAAAVVPLAALALAVRRAAAVRRALGLAAPRHGTDLVALGALVGVVVLLALGAAQPALSHDTVRRVRGDVQALFVLDISRSMAASATRAAPTRLTRATDVAARLRAAIPDVESGIATLTDRVLPDLLPVADVESFAATLDRSIGIEEPPPQTISARATTFGALTAVATGNYFAPGAKRRLVVVLSDGESRPFDPGSLGRALAGESLVVVGVGGAHDAIYTASGAVESAYRPDPSASAQLAALAGATGGRAYRETSVGAAAARLRALAGHGPTHQVVARTTRETPLAPIVAAVALVPLGLLLRRRGKAYS